MVEKPLEPKFLGGVY